MNDPSELMEGEFHPDNPVFARPRKPFCVECGGTHEPSGARLDCMKHWRKIATKNYGLVEWAVALLSSATPNAKLLDEAKQREWCDNFGKFFAEAYAIIGAQVDMTHSSRKY